MRLLVVVATALGDFLGAVELLGEDETDELVREDQRRKRPDEVGTLMDTLVDTIGTANNHDDLARARQLGREEAGKGRGVETPAPLVEEHDEIIGAETGKDAPRLFLARSRALGSRMWQQ